MRWQGGVVLLEGGELAPARDGGIWYAQVAPYLIERYSRSGQLEIQVHRPNDFLPSAERRFSYSTTARFCTRP